MKTFEKKNTIAVIILTITTLISPLSASVLAEDFPMGYSGPGYRPYLDGKIQYGYYIDRFVQLTRRQEERVSKRKQIEEVLNYANQATPQANSAILNDKANLKYQADKLNYDIQSNIQKGRENAAATGEFNYVKNSDGKTTFFTDGLPTTILNERVLDEFGNVSRKNTFNMKYNDGRLLTNYDATIKDNLGNISRMFWSGKYTADSIFYGSDDTAANKHFSEYTVVEYDPAGNKKTTEWKAGYYEGKLLRAFSEYIADAIYGTVSFSRSNIQYKNNDPRQAYSYLEEGYGTDNLWYTSVRTETAYNDKDQVTGYYEETTKTLVDGTQSKTTVEAALTYKAVDHIYKDLEPDADRLAGTKILSIVENPDGSKRTELTVNDYSYDINNNIYNACGYSEFNGQEAQWFEFKDKTGRIVTRQEDENGNYTYFYIDQDTQEKVSVDAGDITSTLKDGNYYSGNSRLSYEILFGKPMFSNVDSRIYYTNSDDGYMFKVEDSRVSYKNGLVNNMQRQLSTDEYSTLWYTYLDRAKTHIETTRIATTYIYDFLGNLQDAKGMGSRTGWEFRTERGDWVFPYTSDLAVSYVVIQGKALRDGFTEIKHYE
ncbi:MAG: hypothetical protein PHC33_00015 [Candidatus Omnitrophica bacterium]|nr:hypothetical protein [Candidatus Omnitrophota bacterium]